MSSAVNPLDRGSVAKFQSRADAVFGNLGGEDARALPETSSSWQLQKEQVFRSGKEADDASSEEEAADQGQQLVTGEMLGLQGEEDEQLMATASNAFCRALDREDEYDATDALASQSLRPNQMLDRPPLETEVLADNVYERRSSHQGAASLDPVAEPPMDVDMGVLGGAAGPSSCSGVAPNMAEAQPPPTTRDGQSNGQTPRPSVWDRLGREAEQPRHGRSRSRGGSRVPDHVRNPHKYTVYQFDEPITVGGGDRAAAVSGHDNDQAARAALAAARQMIMQNEAADEPAAPAEPLPAFGSGIQFRPRDSDQAAAPAGANDGPDADGPSRPAEMRRATARSAANSAAASGSSMAAKDTFGDEPEEDHMQAAPVEIQAIDHASTGPAAANKKRRYRTKPVE
ncbi:hypothetical protein WJX74_001249 [Apatococcus lobatus]|uniref:U5 small nuclear ribonucleoprotein TSSC4 n=1 Tax=Apatococcus lobatus TaxID=904363 RepID=A0AAW1R2J2_9CHLO